MSHELLLQLLTLLVASGAIYGGIRADLRGMKERIGLIEESARQAHNRIDNHLDKG